MEVMVIKTFLGKVRFPRKKLALNKQVAITLGIILLGAILGILQKWLDNIPSNSLPAILQQLDVTNYFGRLAIWILLAMVISIYAESPLRAAINTFFFLISMVTGYYLYCNYVLGFLPKNYMLIWIGFSFVSFFMAYICWYAKGNGIVAILISSIIMGVLLAQAVNLNITQGVYIYHLMDVFTWGIGDIILRRKPREFIATIGLSVVVAFVYQILIPHWG